MLIVQKFGGSSLATMERIRSAAQRTALLHKSGHRVVTVVSAQGDTTDALLEMAKEASPAPSARELDALLATVQMPTGIPVATVAINGGGNAALLACQMLALSDRALSARLKAKREKDTKAVLEKDAAVAAKYNH